MNTPPQPTTRSLAPDPLRASAQAERSSPAVTRRSVVGIVTESVTLSLVQRLGGILLSLVLVRILAKDDFGAYGVASTALTFLMTFSGQQFAELSFFIKEDEDPRYDRHFGFTIILHAGLTLLVLVLAIGALLIDAYKSAAPLLFFGALGPMLNAPRVIYMVSLRRDMNWKRIRTLGVLAFLFSSAMTLSLALAGFGAIALMCQVVLVPIPTLIDMARQRPDLFRASFDLSGYRQALNFGSFRSAGLAADQGRLFLENLAIGGTLGLTTLGVYGRAFGLAQLTSGWFSSQLAGIAYPLLVKFEPCTSSYRRAAGLMVRFCLWAAATPAVASALSAEAAIAVLYGERWLDATPFLRPMVIAVMIATFVGVLNVVALGALGSRFVFINQATMFLIAIAGLILALPFSLAAYAWTLAAGFALAAVGVVVRLWRARGIDLPDFLRAVLPPFALAALAAAAGMSGVWDRVSALPHWAELIVSVSTSALTMGLLIRILDAAGLRRALRFAPGRLQKISSRLLFLPLENVSAEPNAAAAQ
jgi:PST family polysaccharide transporter